MYCNSGCGVSKERGEVGETSPLSESSYACIKDIFSNESDDSDFKEQLIVSEGVSKVKRNFIMWWEKTYGRRSFKRDYDRLWDEEFLGLVVGRKGPVTKFSRKSRRNLMIKLAEMRSPFEFWQDFTFADDVMEGLGIAERATVAAKTLKAFKLWLDREEYKIHGIWKKEWRSRLSGVLQGQHVPHYHLLYSIEGISKEQYFKLAKLFAHKWVEFTGTKACVKAVRVALHHKSYRAINSRKQANHYVSDLKYISKNGEFNAEESIGRNWGYIGEPQFAEKEDFYLNQSEMVLLKRILRRFVQNKNKKYKRIIAEKYSRFFIFIERSTIHRVLEWIARSQMNRAVEGVPF